MSHDRPFLSPAPDEETGLSRAAHDPGRLRTFLLVVGAALILCALLKLPTLRYLHDELDERIYWQLAENLARKGQYTLQGTEIIGTLPPVIFDHPLYHHPPLFATALIPFVLMESKSAALSISWLGHLLAVLAVALVGRRVLQQRGSPSTFTSPVFWVPLLGICTDPLLMFVSRKLWIDSLLSGLVALSAATLLIADGTRRRQMLVLSGTLLGFASLAKLNALAILPVYFWAVWRRESTWHSRFGSMLALFAPAGLLLAPWLIAFYLQCGVFVPPWVKPDAWAIERYPFIKGMVALPWYHYMLKLPLLAPLFFVCLWELLRNPSHWRDARMQFGVAWLVTILVVLTALGIGGFGFQMRHVAPAVTAIYVVALLVLVRESHPATLMAAGFALLIGAVTGAMYLLNPQYDEILSLVELGQAGSF